MGVKHQEFSLVEVQKHNRTDDLWIILWDNVYDITNYQEEHPGGKAYLIENGGVDATSAYEDIGHSADAQDILDAKYLIGHLRMEDKKSTSKEFKFPAIVPRGPCLFTEGDAQAKKHKSRLHTGIFGFGISATALILPRSSYVDTHALRLGARFWYGALSASLACLITIAAAAYWASIHFAMGSEFMKHKSHYKVDPSRVVAKKAVSQGVLDPAEYKPFPLTDKIQLSNDTYKFVFGLPHRNDIVGLPTGQHVAIRAIIDGAPVTRSYTPSSCNKDLGRLEIIIKVYQKGVMTQYLNRLVVGNTVDIRGPKGVLKYHRNLAPSIIMIAGGSGITPMYSIIRRICEDLKDDTKVTLLYANKTEEDIILRDRLDEYSSLRPDNLKVIHILSNPSKAWKGLRGRISKDIVDKLVCRLDGLTTTKVMVCGPPAMETSMVNDLVGLGYDRPKSISHMADQIFLFQ